ncbi:esterase/lipase family protein [Nocardia jejuensis]|uniref:esterase/lipase family protein n=1 Tax=Nocardia jejuensis TaxID=328049 RepID=UPI00083040C7|nr:alpha/beta fold hydrolase [Nocardia jejuensis]
MKHRARSAAFGTALVAAMVMTAGTGTAAADPASTDVTGQALAAAINSGLRPAADGRTPQAIVDSGSGSDWRKSTASDAVGEGPEVSAYLAAFAYGLTHPDAAPPGSNRWDCKPSAEHPRPVVLLHGSWLNAYDTFAFLSPQLARAGMCVFALNFGRSGLLEGGGVGAIMPGRYGVGRIEDSSGQLAAFVDRVRAATGAEQVDIIGHSQGGTLANHYLKFEGGQGKVRELITYGATHHGTSLMGIATLGRMINNLGIDILGFYDPIVGAANIEQAVGSPFYTTLNAGGDTVPGVDYTVVGSRHDEVMNPYEMTFLHAGPGATVENITLQDGCDQDLSDHLTLMYSPRAASIALHALDPAAHPNLTCTFNPWMIGGGGGL